jgi:hypothetical protein
MHPDTFLVLERYLDIYTKLFSGNNYDFTNSFIFDKGINVRRENEILEGCITNHPIEKR